MVEPALLALHFKESCRPVTLTFPFGVTDTSQYASLSNALIPSVTSASPIAQASSFGEQQARLLLGSSRPNLAVPSIASTRIGAPVSFRIQKAWAGPIFIPQASAKTMAGLDEQTCRITLIMHCLPSNVRLCLAPYCQIVCQGLFCFVQTPGATLPCWTSRLSAA